MTLSPQTAITPVDGRYHQTAQRLSAYFSEYALIRYRCEVELRYLFFLADENFFPLSAEAKTSLQNRLEGFGEVDALRVKELEKTTAHDVKAVEYLLKEWMTEAGLDAEKEWIHFGLTSQDINNTAIPMLWRDALQDEVLPELLSLTKTLRRQAHEWRDVPMLARTHGQPASPTRLGKEWMVFVERIERSMHVLAALPHYAKFGGATGNYNAHAVAFPNRDWPALGDAFVESLDLHRSQFTTQIDHYDGLAAQLDAIKRINTILIDLCRDAWTYISMDYFKQKTKEGEIGSSAMPHKVNPIDFENAEGNLGIANALLEHLSAKLPVSRLQRDLTDSTVLRNIGTPIAHGMIALAAIQKGLGKLVLNEEKLNADLEANWAVVAEAVQTVLRREGYPAPYEALKALTRGKGGINRESMHAFIDGLDITDAVKTELKSFTPQNYVGVNPEF